MEGGGCVVHVDVHANSESMMFNCFPDADTRTQAQVGLGLATPLHVTQAACGLLCVHLHIIQFMMCMVVCYYTCNSYNTYTIGSTTGGGGGGGGHTPPNRLAGAHVQSSRHRLQTVCID